MKDTDQPDEPPAPYLNVEVTISLKNVSNFGDLLIYLSLLWKKACVLIEHQHALNFDSQ